MNKPIFVVKQVVDTDLGVEVPTLVKVSDSGEEEWCNVQELDQLFGACVNRWGSNWNLAKVITAIQEADFE